MKKIIPTIVAFLLMLASCQQSGKETTADIVEEDVKSYIERVDTLELIILYPQFTKVDLACGSMPRKSDNNVILVAEAAYTGELLKEFKHTNIAGDHVSGGVRYRGYKCKRNTGAFVYYNGKWKFCHENYSDEMDKAAKNGGAAFGQEMIIHKGKLVPIKRKDTNINQFRALCEIEGRLCVAESNTLIPFGQFKQFLLEAGATEALYMDMGRGWNHAWYRNKGQVVELHPKKHNYCTNWITFYQEK